MDDYVTGNRRRETTENQQNRPTLKRNQLKENRK